MNGKEEASSHSDQEFIDELNYLLTVSKHPRTLKILQDALDCTKIKLSKTKKESKDNGVTYNEETSATRILPREESSCPVKSPITSCTTTRVKDYGWDQSEMFVKIYITSLPGIEKVKPEDVVKEFTKKSMMVQLVGVGGKNYSIVINDLCGAILPDQSFVKVKNGHVTICLKKKDKDEWPYLTGREKKLKETRESKPPKVDKDEDPGLGLMKLMKQMYDEGDDEMKKTIAKAWHESQEKRAKGTDDLTQGTV